MPSEQERKKDEFSVAYIAIFIDALKLSFSLPQTLSQRNIFTKRRTYCNNSYFWYALKSYSLSHGGIAVDIRLSANVQ